MRNDPLNRNDPMGLQSTVGIYSHEVYTQQPVLGEQRKVGNHPFFLITDADTGQQWVSRAGPSVEANLSPLAGILDLDTGGQIEAWIGGIADAPEVLDVDVRNWSLVQDVGTFAESGEQMAGIFESYNTRFNNAGVDYKMQSQNSATYVGEATSSIFGQQVANPGGQGNLSGLNTDVTDIEVQRPHRIRDDY